MTFAVALLFAWIAVLLFRAQHSQCPQCSFSLHRNNKQPLLKCLRVWRMLVWLWVDWFRFRPCTNAWASTGVTTHALSSYKMNHIADLLSASAASTVWCSSWQSQWGAVNISMSGPLYCKYKTVRALNGNIRVNCVSFPPALGLNGDGRSFTVDLNLTASSMVATPASWAPGITKDGVMK